MGSRVLSVLKLRSCNIDTGGTLQLAKTIAGLHSLTILDLSFNTFSSEGMELIGRSSSKSEHALLEIHEFH